VLHALRELAVPVYNDARSIERSVDKSMTTFLLRQHGIATLPTRVSEHDPRLAPSSLLRRTPAPERGQGIGAHRYRARIAA
jgi:glutathione synthase/RimK-type ligase-like ATP-grasp enzyme